MLLKNLFILNISKNWKIYAPSFMLVYFPLKKQKDENFNGLLHMYHRDGLFSFFERLILGSMMTSET